MPLIIVDSDILIDFIRGDRTSADWLDTANAQSTLTISQVTEMELIVGSRDKAHLREIKHFLSRFQLVNINDQISIQASDLIERYCLSHGFFGYRML